MPNMDAMLEAVLLEDAEDDVIDEAIDNGNVDLANTESEEDRYGLSPDQINDVDQLAGIDDDDVNTVDPDEDIEEYVDDEDLDFSDDDEEDSENDEEDITADDMRDAIDTAKDFELESFFSTIY